MTMAGGRQASGRRNWSLDELRVLAAIYFNSSFSIGDDARDECRVIADAFGRTPSSVDRQWRNMAAIVKGDNSYNVGLLVKQAVADYLADPTSSKRFAVHVCEERGWPVANLMDRPHDARLVIPSDSPQAEILAHLYRFCDGIEYKLFSTGSQGFYRQGKLVLSDGRRYQAQVTVVLIGSKDDLSIHLRARVPDVAEAIQPLAARVQAKTFRTGRTGYYGTGKAIVERESFQVSIQAVEIGAK